MAVSDSVQVSGRSPLPESTGLVPERSLAPVPSAVRVKSCVVAVPPLSLTTTLRRCSCGTGLAVFEKVHATLSPSCSTIDRAAVVVLGGVVDTPPPTVQATPVSVHAAGTVSATAYVVKSTMPVNAFVLAVVPSSTRLKPARGAGDAVNANDVDPFGVASLTIVIEAG